MVSHLIDGGAGGLAAVPNQGALIDRVLRQEGILIGTELRTDVIDVGDERTAETVDQVQQSMTIEVDPDEGSGNPGK